MSRRNSTHGRGRNCPASTRRSWSESFHQSAPRYRDAQLLDVPKHVVEIAHAEADGRDGDALVVAMHSLLHVGALHLERIEPVGDDTEGAIVGAVRGRRE